MALDGDHSLLGAPWEAEGSLYIFEHQQEATWAQAARLTAHNPCVPLAYFGMDVAVSGDSAVALALGDDDSEQEGFGSVRAYLFTRGTDGVWSQSAEHLVHTGLF